MIELCVRGFLYSAQTSIANDTVVSLEYSIGVLGAHISNYLGVALKAAHFISDGYLLRTLSMGQNDNMS